MVGAKHRAVVRSFRVLRPLKVFYIIESKVVKMVTSFNITGCRKLIHSLILAMPDFANVGVFLMFVFLLLAAMGLQIYNGF